MRHLRMLADANQAVVRATDELVMLNEVCRIVVEVGGYHSATVTYGSDPHGPLQRAAGSGDAHEAQALPAGTQVRPDPVREALAQGDAAIGREQLPSPPLGAKPASVRRRYASIAAIPLRVRDQVIGVLAVSSVKNAMDARDVAVLSELAGDVGFGLTSLRAHSDRDRAIAQLRATERQYRTLLDHIPDSISRFDMLGRFVYVSPSVLKATGRPFDDILGKTLVEVAPADDPADNERLASSVRRVLEGGAPERLEVRFATPSGPCPVEVRHIPERSDDGVVTGVLGIATDLAERRRAEEQLYLLNFALDRVSDGIFLTDSDEPTFTYVNQSAASSLGYSRKELVGGMSVPDIDPEWTRERWREALPAIKTGRRLVIETTHRTRDGQPVPVEVSCNYFEHGGRGYNLAIARNVSERRDAEATLRASELAYRSLVENTPDFIVRWDRQLNRVFVNERYASSLGRSAAEMVLGGFGAYVPSGQADALARAGAAIKAVFEHGQEQLLEEQLHSVSGVRVIQLKLVPERDASGMITTVLGIGRDITSLKEVERQLRSLTEHAPDIILRFDREGRYLYANRALELASGRSAADHIGHLFGTVAGRAPSRVYEELRWRIGQVFVSGATIETEVRIPLLDGEHDFNVRLIPETDEDGNVVTVLGIARDITLQKLALDALEASEQRFRQVTENIDEVFWLTDVDKREMIYVSPAYERVFGASRDDVLADPRAWLALVHPDDRRRVERALPLQASGGYDLEYRIQRRDGTRWIHDRAFPIADEQGNTYRVAGVAEDVTVRRTLEDQLRQAQKMEAVGQLAGGIAHDFNNILAVIQMQSTLLLDEPLAPSTRDGIHEIIQASERASRLTRQLLTFSRRQATQAVDMDLVEAVVNTTQLLRRVLGEDIALATRFPSRELFVHADPSMMEQVLMNLTINARDAMPGGGQLSIALDELTVDGQRAAGHPGITAGPFVCLSVADTGAGIPPESLPRIFEPFFSTKEVGKGTGLGLATVFGIVEQHAGWIEVESTLGAGSTFRVYLPALSRAPRLGASPADPDQVQRGGETVLLVEDDGAVRATARAVLTHYGYQVLEADSAASAREVWASAHTSIRLLMTDLIMPGGVSGRQLADELLSLQPTLRVVYTTGYSPDLVNEMVALDATRVLLQKPYAAGELAASVRRALDAPRATPD